MNTSLSGKHVDAGDPIGVAGNTGGNYELHLHFGIVLSRSGRGSEFANSSDALLAVERKTWVRQPGFIEGQIVNNPAGNSPAGTPSGIAAESVSAHQGSVRYTRNVNEVSIGGDSVDLHPGKPEFIRLEGVHFADEPITFSWSPTARTTHYNIWVYKEDSSGQYTAVRHDTYVSSGYQLTLDPGNYKAELQSYNSNAWASDGSDWLYTESDPTYFSVVQQAYTVSYDANGGSGAPSAQTKTYDVALTLSTSKPTRTGYVFLGWATSATATSAQYQPGESYTANADVTLYAVWVKSYTVSYDANGGTGAPNSQTKVQGQTLTLSATRPTRPCHVFIGWATSATATTAQYQPGGSFTTNANTTLYAVWEEGTQSEWSTTRPTGVDESMIEEKTQYRYRDKVTATSNQGNPSDWTLIGSHVEYGSWSGNQTTTTEPTESDTLRIVDQYVSAYNYFHYCCNYYDGCYNVDSIPYGDTSSTHHHTTSTSSALPVCSIGDVGGQQPYGGSGSGAPVCSSNFYVWFLDSVTYTYVYQERTATTVYEYWTGWSDWSDTVYTASDSRQVETRTMYRYVQSGDVHQWDSGVVTTQPTCTTKGVMTYTCSKCGKTRTTDIAATGHSWGTPTYTWSTDNKTATAKRVCANNSSHVETETVNTTSQVTTAATCTTKGKTTYTATFTNSAFATQTKTVENIPATGHNWGTPTYTWSTDNKTVTAKRVCANNSSHVETETVNTTSQVTTAATCTTKGKTTYTATFTNSAFATQTKTVENIPATGHNWGEWVVTTPATVNQPGVQTRTCSRCGATETRSYAAETVTITYNANGGSVSPASVTILKNGIISSLPTPTRTGYTFNGWYTAASGGTKVTTSTSFAADATIYAQWTVITYSVTFNANGGTGAPEAQTKTHDVALTLSTTVPTREGYTFLGWATAADATQASLQPGGSYTANADVTLYAVWQQNQVEPDPDALTLTLTDAEARPGESFTVTLQLTNNPGVTGLSAELVFDESVMTLVSAAPKIESGTWSVDSIAEDHLIFWYDTETFAGEDVIELSFRVADNAPEGDFPIGLQFGEWDSIVDAEGEEIAAYSVVPGTLTVTHRVPGDVTGDGRVNLSDVVRLAQYVKARGQGVEIVPNSGDTNGDGRVNLSDVVRLAQYVKARGVGVVIY